MKKTLLTILGITGIALSTIFNPGCVSRKYVENHDITQEGKSYSDPNKFKMKFLKINETPYAIQEMNQTEMDDSTIVEKTQYFRATQRDDLELQEEGNRNTFNWDPNKTIYFKPTNEKIYVGDAKTSRRVRKNKSTSTNRDYDTDLEDFFDSKPEKIGNKEYFTKQIGNKLYLIEIPKNKRNQKFNKNTPFGSLKVYLQAKEGENAIYVADISSFKDRTKQTRSTSALIRATPRVRVINSGETLSKIAREYNTTVEKLKVLNGLKDVDKISVGQHIRVK